jgi:hypothetical protein
VLLGQGCVLYSPGKGTFYSGIKFRMQLSRCSRHGHRWLSSGGGRSEITGENLNRCLVNTEPTEEAGALSGSTAQRLNVDKYVANMPLCMRRYPIGDAARQETAPLGSLRLFLKGAGLSMDETRSCSFKEHFSCVTGEVFQKRYSYNIRHMYAESGRRMRQPNCSKVIYGNAPAIFKRSPWLSLQTLRHGSFGRLIAKAESGFARPIFYLRAPKSNQYQLA